MLADDVLKRMKTILRENEVPYFEDEELNFYVKERNGDVDAAIYDCLIVKSQNSTLSVSGLSTADTSSYFKRLAVKYKPNHSGILN